MQILIVPTLVKVEVNLATLWEDPGDKKSLVHERSHAVVSIEAILDQLALWEAADKMQREVARAQT